MQNLLENERLVMQNLFNPKPFPFLSFLFLSLSFYFRCFSFSFYFFFLFYLWLECYQSQKTAFFIRLINRNKFSLSKKREDEQENIWVF